MAAPGLSSAELLRRLNIEERKSGRDGVEGDNSESIMADLAREGFFHREGDGRAQAAQESFAQVETPDPAEVVLELLSLNYSETLSAAAGWSMEEAKEQTIESGNYVLVYEGAVLEGWGGQALRVADKPGTEHLIEAAKNAKTVVALGSCAVNGGWMGAHPNSSDALGVEQFLKKSGIEVPVVNIPGCPANPEWLVSVLVDVIMLDSKQPKLTSDNKPESIFGQTIHDNCERRGHFENGEFVYKFGSEEEAKGYCLYPLGCRGPQTKSTCGITMWNNRRSWCVQAGSPCIGCCEANPNDPGDNWVEVNTRSTSAIATCASATGWFSPARSLSRLQASSLQRSSCTASA